VTDEHIAQSQSESEPQHGRLQALVGRWRTTGRTNPDLSGSDAEIAATDTYDWLPGGFGLLHTVDARVGDEKVQGAEIIGYDPSREAYITQYFGSDGPNAYQATLTEEDGALVWRMHSERDRFTGIFDDDRTTITGHWDLLGEDGSWRPWMDITLIKS
jgi:hypothetical protein